MGWRVWQTLGGNLGMCICNDRRWPETYRVMGLQNVEMVLIGYNTPRHHPPAPDHDALSDFHNRLSMQGGAYANATWVVGMAKAGIEEGCELIGGSCIIAPTGQIVAQASGLGWWSPAATSTWEGATRTRPSTLPATGSPSSIA